MAKRFTDTDKWKKAFIKSLPTEYKLLWIFLTDECDHSGIWHVEMDIVEVRLGIKFKPEDIKRVFKEKIIEFDNGKKIFIPDFVLFQYGDLNPTNKAHASVIKSLNKYKLMEYVSPLDGAKDKALDKDMDKEEQKIEKNISPEKAKDLGLIFDIEKEFSTNQIQFERICIAAQKKEKLARDALRNYHLWLIEKDLYPMARQRLYAGFEKWLRNERKKPEQENENATKPEKSARERKDEESLASIN